MSGCPSFEELILEHASGPVPPDDQARLEAHLPGCAGCQRALEEARALFGAAALPEPSALEQQALASLPTRTRAALRTADRRRAWFRGSSAALLAAAAALLVVFAPGWGRRGATPVSAPAPATPVEARAPSPEEPGSELALWALSDPLGDALSDSDGSLAAPGSFGGSDDELSTGDDEGLDEGAPEADDELLDLSLTAGEGS